MTMQMAALTIMVWNTMARIKLESPGNRNSFLLSSHVYFSKNSLSDTS
jgi:hypothetical protein